MKRTRIALSYFSDQFRILRYSFQKGNSLMIVLRWTFGFVAVLFFCMVSSWHVWANEPSEYQSTMATCQEQFKSRKPFQAYQYAERALTLASTNGEKQNAVNQMVRALNDQKKHLQASEMIERHLGLWSGPQQADRLMDAARQSSYARNEGKEKAFLDRAMDQKEISDDQKTRVHLMYAEYHRRYKRYEDSIAEATKAMGIAPNLNLKAQVLHNLANSYWDQKQYREGADLLEKSLSKYPWTPQQCADFQRRTGEFYQRMENYKESDRYANLLLEIQDKKNWNYLRGIQMLYNNQVAQKQFTSAIQLLSGYLKDPNLNDRQKAELFNNGLSLFLYQYPDAKYETFDAFFSQLDQMGYQEQNLLRIYWTVIQYFRNRVKKNPRFIEPGLNYAKKRLGIEQIPAIDKAYTYDAMADLYDAYPEKEKHPELVQENRRQAIAYCKEAIKENRDLGFRANVQQTLTSMMLKLDPLNSAELKDSAYSQLENPRSNVWQKNYAIDAIIRAEMKDRRFSDALALMEQRLNFMKDNQERANQLRWFANNMQNHSLKYAIQAVQKAIALPDLQENTKADLEKFLDTLEAKRKAAIAAKKQKK